jgi:hypothetical protein
VERGRSTFDISFHRRKERGKLSKASDADLSEAQTGVGLKCFFIFLHACSINIDMKVIIPPIKSQGIKTKLVPWIKDIAPKVSGRWIEPFLGTGVVAFNAGYRKAILNDTNPLTSSLLTFPPLAKSLFGLIINHIRNVIQVIWVTQGLLKDNGYTINKPFLHTKLLKRSHLFLVLVASH